MDKKDTIVSKREIRNSLYTGLLWGVLIILASIVVVYSATGNPYHEYLLMTKGITTNAIITDVDEEIEPRDAGGNTYYYYFRFNFTLPGGQNIESVQEFSGGSSQEIPETPTITEVVYLKDRPEINKIKKSLSSGVFELLWRKIGLGLLLLLLFSSLGIVLIRNAIKEYSAGLKKIAKPNLPAKILE